MGKNEVSFSSIFPVFSSSEHCENFVTYYEREMD